MVFFLLPGFSAPRKGGGAYLGCQTLVGAVGQEEAHDAIVVLLRRHVQRREAVLRLNVDRAAILNEDLDHFFLAGCRSGN